MLPLRTPVLLLGVVLQKFDEIVVEGVPEGTPSSVPLPGPNSRSPTSRPYLAGPEAGRHPSEIPPPVCRTTGLFPILRADLRSLSEPFHPPSSSQPTKFLFRGPSEDGACPEIGNPSL